jgi:hypothetical protein
MHWRVFAVVVVLGLTTLAILDTRATEPTDSAIPTTAPEQTNAPPPISLTTMTEADAETLSPVMRETRKALLQEVTDIGILTQRLTEVEDRLAALDLQREISDRKLRTQIEMLEIQGRYARQEGRIELAEEAERAVSRLKTRLERGGE